MNIKKVDFGPNRARFDPFGPLTWERDFSRACGFRRKLRNIMFFHFKHKKVHINGLDFQQNCKNPILGLIWPLFGQKQGNRIFPEKLGSVTFLHLWTPNFMQKIRKNSWANSEKSVLLTYLPTYWPTDQTNFIGPFHFVGDQKCFSIKIKFCNSK